MRTNMALAAACLLPITVLFSLAAFAAPDLPFIITREHVIAG